MERRGHPDGGRSLTGTDRLGAAALSSYSRPLLNRAQRGRSGAQPGQRSSAACWVSAVGLLVPGWALVGAGWELLYCQRPLPLAKLALAWGRGSLSKR
jgi:hypothetical protein